jgi:hypothetical protein
MNIEYLIKNLKTPFIKLYALIKNIYLKKLYFKIIGIKRARTVLRYQFFT